MAGGRPTKYTEDLPDALLDALAAGKSVTQFAAQIGVHRATIYSWAERHPEFSDAVDKGTYLSKSYWCNAIEDIIVSSQNAQTLDFTEEAA